MHIHLDIKRTSVNVDPWNRGSTLWGYERLIFHMNNACISLNWIEDWFLESVIHGETKSVITYYFFQTPWLTRMLPWVKGIEIWSLELYNSKIIMNRRKRVIAYLIGLAVIVYCGVQMMYMKDVYSPLQVLADAHSEAKRLMRFITAYHFMCNSTMILSNATNWPLCLEQDGGINLDSSTTRVIYSIG